MPGAIIKIHSIIIPWEWGKEGGIFHFNEWIILQKMVNGLVLRLDNYEEETIIIMYSPDLPKCLPIFAIFSIAWVLIYSQHFHFPILASNLAKFPKLANGSNYILNRNNFRWIDYNNIYIPTIFHSWNAAIRPNPSN